MSLSQLPAYVAPKKRKKTSGLTGLELRTAFTSLQSVKASLRELAATTGPDAIDDPQIQGDLVTLGSDFEETLDKILEMMRSKLDGPQALSFSGVKFEHLTQLNIEDRGSLQLKSDYVTRATATDILGTTEHWSSEGLYRHLNVLQNLVPKANEAAARTWIDAFFFRAAAMPPPGKKLVLSLEQSVPATAMIPFNLTTAGGFIDYTAITANEKDAKAFLKHPILEKLTKHDHTLFVSEAKAKDVSLEDHIPQAVCEMYACAKKLQKDIIRGALTNGHDWIFIFLRMNSDGNGGVYAESEKTRLMTVVPPGIEEISRTMCATISGIIAHWIDHSNEDIGDDDWFTAEWS